MKSSTQRRIQLGSTTVDYNLVISKAAHQSRLRVGPSGVEVIQPVGSGVADASSFLLRNERWVLAQLERVSTLSSLRRPDSFQTGEILYRGESTLVRVVIADTKARGNLVSWSEGEITVQRGLYTITSAAHGLENWLRRKARSRIADLLNELTQRIPQRPGRIYVMDQRTKWGNCSSRGNLSFNWRLVLAPDYVLRYLVTHEAAHLAVPDHSAKFWLTVQSLCPDAERAKQWLSRHHAHLRVDLASIVGSEHLVRDGKGS